MTAIVHLLIALTTSAHGADVGPGYTILERGQAQQLWLDGGVGAEAATAADRTRSSTMGAGFQLRAYPAGSRRDLATGLPHSDTLLPVLRQGNAADAPWLVPSGGVVVDSADPATLQRWAQQQRLALRPAGVAGYWLLDTAAGLPSLQAASAIATLPGVQSVSPQWWRARTLR